MDPNPSRDPDTGAHQPGNSPNLRTTGLLADVKTMNVRDVKTLVDFVDAEVRKVHNDRNLLLERLIQFLAKLPPRSRTAKKLTDGLVHTLWESLSHPPLTSLGHEHKYREADGSNNNIHAPRLGAANTAYARSIKPAVFQDPNPPDAALIFDALMVRDPSKFRPHPNKISSMLFYMATIITHDIFQTSSRDLNVNLTSSYLDLSPLYGRSQEEQLTMRTTQNGLLKADCFSSKRVLGFPPGVGAFLIMFNRFHNHVAKELAEINEGGRFTRPQGDPSASPAWVKYDNDLFQTARLITCGLYINIVLGDYVRTILNLNRTDSIWSIDPRTKEGKSLFSASTAEAVGNQVTVEFNLIYRWHCSISQRDDKWTTDELRRLLHGRDPATASMGEVLGAMRGFEDSIPADPIERPFAGLKRGAQPDAGFDDDGLVRILRESVEDVAGAFGPNHIPACMRAIEILGIKQARYWNVATLNEFRDFVGLARYKTFAEINPDPAVASTLSKLYRSPDTVELYPGIVAEQPKPPLSPGSGLCPSYTTSRAILADAVALVRGDRFYTVDYTPKNLTNWGFAEASYDTRINNGHVMYKLFTRAFPDHFDARSVYASFPFVVPSENRVILAGMGVASRFTWERSERREQPRIATSHADAVAVLNNTHNLRQTWLSALKDLGVKPASARLGIQGLESSSPSPKALPSGWHEQIRTFYDTAARTLLSRHAIAIPSLGVNEVDIIHDVIALAHTRLTAAMLSLDLQPSGKKRSYTDHELYHDLTAVFSAAFSNTDGRASKTIVQASTESKGRLESALASRGSFFSKLLGLGGPSGGVLQVLGERIRQNLFGSASTTEETSWALELATAAVWTANLTLLTSQSLDYYLGDGVQHLDELRHLAAAATPDADETLAKYVLEGVRLGSNTAAYRVKASDNAATSTEISNGAKSGTGVTLKTGRSSGTEEGEQAILVDLSAASRDPSVIPDPDTVRTDRPPAAYAHLAALFGGGVGAEVGYAAIVALLKTLLRLPGLQRTDGPRGQIKSVPLAGIASSGSSPRIFMTEDQGSFAPVPTTMRIRWRVEG